MPNMPSSPSQKEQIATKMSLTGVIRDSDQAVIDAGLLLKACHQDWYELAGPAVREALM
jgi:hypothetical protein